MFSKVCPFRVSDFPIKLASSQSAASPTNDNALRRGIEWSGIICLLQSFNSSRYHYLGNPSSFCWDKRLFFKLCRRLLVAAYLCFTLSHQNVPPPSWMSSSRCHFQQTKEILHNTMKKEVYSGVPVRFLDRAQTTAFTVSTNFTLLCEFTRVDRPPLAMTPTSARCSR